MSREPFVRAVARFVEEQGLLRQGDRVCVGLSGGADSVALLAVLLDLRDSLNLTVSCCHVNHNLRGEESLRDESFVKDLCAALRVPLRCFSVNCRGAVQNGLSLETAARNERYRCFETAAREGECLVATAHTASDQAETVLFRLARGTGLKGLCGIPVRRGLFIRPLLCVTRRQVEEYVREKGLSFVTDSTNLTDDCTRNRLRHRVVPQLKELNPAFEAAVCRMSAALREDEQVLAELSRTEYERFSASGFSLAVFRSVPEGLRNRVIHEFFCRHGLLFDAKKCILIRSLTDAGNGAVQVGKEQIVSAAGGRLGLKTISTPVFHEEECPFLPPRTVFLHIAAEKQSLSDIHNADTFLMVDYDKLIGKPILRTRRPGDAIRLPGRPEKTVKKLYSEQKTENRDEKVLICDALGVVWLEDAGPAARAAVDETTKTILKMGVVCFDER